MPTCAARLAAGLTQLQQYFQQQLQPAASYKGSVLPGHVLSAAALLLSEGCCWVELCLEVRNCKLSRTVLCWVFWWGLLAAAYVRNLSCSILCDIQLAWNRLCRALSACVCAAKAVMHLQHPSSSAAATTLVGLCPPGGVEPGCMRPTAGLDCVLYPRHLLQSWSKALRACKKKKGGKAASADVAHPQLDQAAQSLAQVQQALFSLLQALQDGAQRLLQQPVDAAAAAVLAELDESSDAALKVLVGWEQRVSVQLVLTELVKQQRVLLGQIKDSSSRMHKRLQAVTW